jgi:hypothetical protein
MPVVREPDVSEKVANLPGCSPLTPVDPSGNPGHLVVGPPLFLGAKTPVYRY